MAARNADPRDLAWRVLRAVEEDAFADAALAKAMREHRLERRDRALATRLVYGSIAWQGRSDHILDTLGRPAGKLDVAVRTLLRLAFFQLLELDRVPDFAVVDTSVRLAKSHRGGSASGLVNALLRRFLREGKTLQLPNDPRAALAVRYSHPRWLVDRWLTELGEEPTKLLLAANNEAAPTVLRTNLTRTTRKAAVAALGPATASEAAISPAAIRCEPTGPLVDLDAYRKGLVSPQGEASQLVGLLVPVGDSASVLDMCAAPGGKSAHLAERGATVLAVDRAIAGLRASRTGAKRLGVGIGHLCADASALPLRSGAVFDAVLVDAPCSGLGTLRQHPEIRWRRTPRDIEDLARRQTDILNQAATRVRPGGALVYSTCTIVKAENEERIADFLASHGDFTLESPSDALPEPARQLIGTDHFLRTFPHQHDTDGFFAARLRRA